MTGTVEAPVVESKVESPATQTSESGTEQGSYTRAHARPRMRAGAEGVTSSPLSTLPAKGSPLGDWTKARWQRLVNSSPYAGQPPSIRDRVSYTNAGGWVPGDRAAWLEFFGKAYGWLIAIPTTAALYAISWWIAKPTRVLTLILLYSLTRWGA